VPGRLVSLRDGVTIIDEGDELKIPDENVSYRIVLRGHDEIGIKILEHPFGNMIGKILFLNDLTSINLNDWLGRSVLKKERVKIMGIEKTKLGIFLTELRTSKDIGQKEIAESICVDPSYISQVENGRVKRPRDKILKKFADFYNISVDALIEKAGPIPKRGPGSEKRKVATVNTPEEFIEAFPPAESKALQPIKSVVDVGSNEFKRELLKTFGKTIELKTELDLVKRFNTGKQKVNLDFKKFDEFFDDTRRLLAVLCVDAMEG